MSKPLTKLAGVVPPVGTPLADDDRVDCAGLRRLVRYLLVNGVHALFANGSMSGFAFLTDSEQMRAIETVIEEAAGRVPVMAGLGETSTSRAIPRAKAMARAGADYLSILPPFYFLASQEHIHAYCAAIAEAVDIPVLLYDNPVLTKNPLQPATIAALRRACPNIVGVKESNQDCVNLQELLERVRGDDGFSVLTGSEFLIDLHLQMGVAGCVGGIHNICPGIAVALYDAFFRGDRQTATRMQRALSAAWRIFEHGRIWGAFDFALDYLGICRRATGRPYVTPLTQAEREAVTAILDQHVGEWKGRAGELQPAGAAR